MEQNSGMEQNTGRRIYLVRHGAVEFQGGIHRCIGRTDVPLAEGGRAQAEHLAKYFVTHSVTQIFTSPPWSGAGRLPEF